MGFFSNIFSAGKNEINSNLEYQIKLQLDSGNDLNKVDRENLTTYQLATHRPFKISSELIWSLLDKGADYTLNLPRNDKS